MAAQLFCWQGGFAITPSDSADLPKPAIGLNAGGAGTIKVNMVNGDIGVTWTIAAGGVLPVAVTKVYATGTTATSIVGGI